MKAICMAYTDSPSTRNAVVAIRTHSCCVVCAEAAARLLGYRKSAHPWNNEACSVICRDALKSVGRTWHDGLDTKHSDFALMCLRPSRNYQMEMAYALRRQAWCHKNLSDLKWLYRHCRGVVRLKQIECWAFQACPDWTVSRLRCYQYLFTWWVSQPITTDRLFYQSSADQSLFWKHVFQRARMCEAACKVQEAWRKAISHPTHALCRARLMREFGELESY